jgi:RND family efflux transporter MFP subunit
LLTAGVLAFLIFSPFKSAQPPPVDAPKTVDAVEAAGPGLIRIRPGTPLQRKLAVVIVGTETISAPVLTVTGSVVARLRPGSGPAEDRWQFSTPDLLSAYTDWRKSNGDVELAEKQLKEIRELTNDRIATQKKVVERLRKLVEAGTDSPKDLAAEEGNLRQATIQGRKDVIEAETAARAAVRNRASLERQLSQGGADPNLLARAPEGTAVVMADVPEARLALVHQGQACQARFFSFPGQVLNGRVSSLAPTISKERRTMRVLFDLKDADGRLKPGMFAEVGLGTDSREAIMAPADGVIHVGRSDYVLVGADKDLWRVSEVKVGELRGSRVDVLEGLRTGERVIGAGAILLKPFIVQTVQVVSQSISETMAPVRQSTGR